MSAVWARSDDGAVRVQRGETAGTFSLDGGTWEVENNIYVIGTDTSCLVIDPAHDAQAVSEIVGERTVEAVILTHGHDDHIGQAREFARGHDAPIWISSADRMLWDDQYPHAAPDHDLAPDTQLSIGGITLQVLATPGHSPGSVCLHAPQLTALSEAAGESVEGSQGVVFSGDTLFQGGPGATGRSYSSYETITESIRSVLFALPDATAVFTGHGDPTTIGQERAQADF